MDRNFQSWFQRMRNDILLDVYEQHKDWFDQSDEFEDVALGLYERGWSALDASNEIERLLGKGDIGHA